MSSLAALRCFSWQCWPNTAFRTLPMLSTTLSGGLRAASPGPTTRSFICRVVDTCMFVYRIYTQVERHVRDSDSKVLVGGVGGSRSSADSAAPGCTAHHSSYAGSRVPMSLHRSSTTAMIINKQTNKQPVDSVTPNERRRVGPEGGGDTGYSRGTPLRRRLASLFANILTVQSSGIMIR